MGFGKELLRLRKEQKLSQDALAVDIGVHRAMTRWVIEPAPAAEIGARTFTTIHSST